MVIWVLMMMMMMMMMMMTIIFDLISPYYPALTLSSLSPLPYHPYPTILAHQMTCYHSPVYSATIAWHLMLWKLTMSPAAKRTRAISTGTRARVPQVTYMIWVKFNVHIYG